MTNDFSIRLASKDGYDKFVDLLCKEDANIHADDDFVIRLASKDDYNKFFDLLCKEDAKISE